MPRSEKPAILVVEDHPALLRIIVRTLQHAGFTTIAARDAAQGLEMARQSNGTLALAILDIVMPGMSGLDLACDLDREYPELKILYISGFVDSIAAEVLSRRSPQQMLLKPFGAQTLLDRVSLLLGVPAVRRHAGRSEQTSLAPPRNRKVG